jgi:hypothetical protein
MIEWHEVMVHTSIDIFEILYGESVSYFHHLENLEKIRHINSPGLATLPVDSKKIVSVTSSVGKSSKKNEPSNMQCHYCDKNNHNKADYRATAKFKQQKRSPFEAKSGSRNKFLDFLFEEINTLKKHMKPEKTVNNNKGNANSFPSTDVNEVT